MTAVKVCKLQSPDFFSEQVLSIRHFLVSRAWHCSAGALATRREQTTILNLLVI